MSLPSLPADFQGDFVAVGSVAAPVTVSIEPVGQFFLAHATRTLQDRTWSEHEKITAEKAAELAASNQKDDEDEFEDVTDEELLTHDPREWKTADLYAVLGLNNLRYSATPDQIDRAYRKQVLTFHPDKQGEKTGFQDGFFKIIQKAYETLQDSNKRRQFDSVDTEADVAPPSGKSYDFYEAWTPVFAAEGRFSTRDNVPSLGDKDSSKEEVEAFYKFFNNFDSWRTFEFLDEDVPDDTSNRDHKRYIEKKNNNARRKRKTEDIKRLAELVRRAHQEDPRIKAFKEEEKAEKAKRKWDREAGARKAAEEAKAKAEAEAKAKAEAEAIAKAQQQKNKKSKEAAKSAKKKNKRVIRNSVKDNNYFGDEAEATKIDADIETLLAALDADQLADAVEKINLAGDDSAAVKDAISSSAKSAGKDLSYF